MALRTRSYWISCCTSIRTLYFTVTQLLGDRVRLIVSMWRFPCWIIRLRLHCDIRRNRHRRLFRFLPKRKSLHRMIILMQLGFFLSQIGSLLLLRLSFLSLRCWIGNLGCGGVGLSEDVGGFGRTQHVVWFLFCCCVQFGYLLCFCRGVKGRLLFGLYYWVWSFLVLEFGFAWLDLGLAYSFNSTGRRTLFRRLNKQFFFYCFSRHFSF